MSKIHAVLDTCGIVKRYNALEQGRELIEQLFACRLTITIHLPNVCIPEVRYTFQKQRSSRNVNNTTINQMRKAFTCDIEDYRIHVYHVGGRILTMTDELMKLAFRAGTGTKIQPIDCIVLAVTKTLSRVMNGVVLVTADGDLETMARRDNLHVWNPLKIKRIPNKIPRRKKS